MSNSKKNLELFKGTMEQRLYEASKFWNYAESEYNSINDFTSSFNALLQSLRNITFIIQSNKGLIKNFDSWYLKKQEEMKDDQLLRWLVKARNIVVKQDNLKLKSKVKVDLYNWEKYPVMEIIFDPFNSIEAIRKTILADIEKNQLIKKLRQPILRIEREWISDNLPDKELLLLTAYCYQYLKLLVIEAFEISNIDTTNITSNFEKNIHILDNQSLFLNNRTTVVDLRSGKNFSLIEKRIKRDHSIDTIVSKRYSLPKTLKRSKGLRGLLEMADISSKKIMMVDGYHIPTALFHTKSGKGGIYSFPINDRSELYLAIRNVADKIIENKEIIGVVLVVEMWIKSLDFKIEGEAILVAMISDNESEIRFTRFTRSNQIKFFKTRYDDKSNYPFLKPIIDSFKGRS